MTVNIWGNTSSSVRQLKECHCQPW